MADLDPAAVMHSYALLNRLIATGSEDDLAALLAGLDPRIELREGFLVDRETYHGHEGFLRWLARSGGAFGRARFGIERLYVSRDAAVARTRVLVQAASSGIEGTIESYNAGRWRDGRMTLMAVYATLDEALAAVDVNERDEVALPSSCVFPDEVSP
jgi:hypothetical protein